MHKGTDITDTLVRSLTELRALERYILEALELQRHEEALDDHRGATETIEQTINLLHEHVAQLDLQLATLGGSREALRAAASSMAGAFLGFLSKSRSHEPSKMLRDDYTLLHLASTTYLMLHTMAVALRQPKIADIAIKHHRELAPVVNDIVAMLPHVVLHDLSQHFGGLNRTAAETTILAATEITSESSDTTWAATA